MISIRPAELRNAYDAVIIGAGVGGLVCAGFLARSGRSVLLLDHHYLPGGFCTAFPRKGYTFDAAVHHIGACGRFGTVGRIVKQFGIPLRFVHLDPMDHLVFPDMEVTVPADMDQYCEELQSRFPGERERLPGLFRDLRRLYRQILRGEGELYERYLGATFAELLGDYVGDPGLQRVLGGQWGYLGSPVAEISAIGMVQMVVSYLRDGAWYPLGSTQHFSNALAQSLLDVGGHLLLKNKVEEVLVEDERVAGVRLEGGRTVRTPLVVSNVDARQLFQDLVPEPACAAERQRIGVLTAAPSYFGLYLAIDGAADLSPLQRGFYFPPGDACEGAVEWIYLSVTTRYDASLAPAGKHVLSATVGVRAGSPQYHAWQEDRAAMVRSLLSYLESRAPGLERHIEFTDSASPRTLARYTLAKGGTAYGWAVLPDQAGDRRFPSSTSLPGLHLVGQWTSPGPGVAAVAASGWSVANRLLAQQAS